MDTETIPHQYTRNSVPLGSHKLGEFGNIKVNHISGVATVSGEQVPYSRTMIELTFENGQGEGMNLSLQGMTSDEIKSLAKEFIKIGQKMTLLGL